MSCGHEKNTPYSIEAYQGHIQRKKLLLLGVFLFVLVLMILSLGTGSTKLSPREIIHTLFSGEQTKTRIIVWKLRLPRVIAALVAGWGLSISGCVMQTCLGNPLASPSTLGLSQGAIFGANLAILLFGAGTLQHTGGDALVLNSPYLVTICAFAFAMLSTVMILSLARLRHFSKESIVLSGVALGSLFAAATTILQYFSTDVRIAAALFWSFGDLGRIVWKELLILTAVVVPISVFYYLQRWSYNALLTGEDTAKTLGIKTKALRFWSLLLAALITSVAVSFLGMIGFIGLVGPQMMRRVLGDDHRFLLPASALAGACILLASDTLARTVISPIVLPVGAITSLLGGPTFLYLLMKGKRS